MEKTVNQYIVLERRYFKKEANGIQNEFSYFLSQCGFSDSECESIDQITVNVASVIVDDE